VAGRDLQWLVKGLTPEPARAQGEREKGLHEALPLQLQHVRLSEADEADELELAELSGEEEADGQWPTERGCLIRKEGCLESWGHHHVPQRSFSNPQPRDCRWVARLRGRRNNPARHGTWI
jgi:hypothetical protein